MNIQSKKLSCIILEVSFSLAGWAGNPCMPIAQACMKEGYYKGGRDVGKGLIEDCVQPVVAKQKVLAANTFSDDALQQCGAMLAKKMGNQDQ